MAFHFDPNLARTVKADTLEPVQRPTPRKLKTAVDFHAQVMLKHPHLSEFHNGVEWLHAGLLEGDPRVISFVPQPLLLRVGKRWYTPDCYVVAEDAPRRVLELRPEGKLDEALRVPVTHFLAQHHLRFEVVSNESVLERESEALNWLEIVRILYLGRELDTLDAEQRVLARLAQQGPCALGDIIDPGDRAGTYDLELALLRLLHRGQVRAALTEQALDYDTECALCV